MKPSLCLNMIVKNEADRIERCLVSVLPYVKSAAILDTGSTDDTIKIVERLCKDAGVWLTIGEAPFENFSQARNEAFRLAQSNNVADAWCQFAFLVDADMVLEVIDPKAFDGLDANALSYDMMQTGGSVSYANRRIANLNAKSDPYVGVTHEYLDLPSAGMISGARFVDYADGSNRKDKYARDVALLNEALKTDPYNGRYLYYLGNTYRDGNDPHLAIDAYQRRLALGGWDEEVHSTMMNLAFSHRDAGNEPKFVAGLVAAYDYRPSRAEPLYDLAKHYREKGNNAAALVFAEAGVNKKRPDDLLFVNDYVYSHGLRYELSIVSYYDEAKRGRAFEITDDLALDPTCPSDIRWSARHNLYWHTKPLGYYCPSFRGQPIEFTPPEGYTAMNPSIEVCNGHIKCNLRCVNYKIDEHGRYMIGPLECNDAPIDTINFLLTLDQDLQTDHAREIVWDRPPAAWGMVTGLEDVRLFRYCGELNFSATVRELSAGGVCQIVTGKLVFDPVNDDTMKVDAWKVVSNADTYEKNWMPMPSRVYSGPRWMYRLDVVVEPGHETIKLRSKLHVGDISGSSQLIPFKQGFLAVVHEADTAPDGKRTYWHRFAWFDRNGELHRLSLPFVFYDRQIEFCAGLAEHPNHKELIISFGVRDAEAHLATVSIEEVARMIWKEI